MRKKVVGYHAVGALAQAGAEQVDRVLLDRSKRNKRMDKLVEILNEKGVETDFVDRIQLDQASDHQRHQGVVALCRETQKSMVPTNLHDILRCSAETSIILILDQVKDPHNLGACIRTAECCGAEALIVPKDNACPVTDTVRKVASGAAERLPVIRAGNLAAAAAELKHHGYWIYGTSDQAVDTIYACRFSGRIALILGSEDKGMRQRTLAQCDHVVRIPMHGETPSLNVAVAAGVSLFEIRRQLGGRE